MSFHQTPWLWRRPGWPALTFDATAVADDLALIYAHLGALESKAVALGLDVTSDFAIDAATDEVLATAAIEGEQFPRDSVRSSIMRRLGLHASGHVPRDVEGLVEVIDDATTGLDRPLDEHRLMRWHASLFPDGRSGVRRIAVGAWRDHEDPMQIVSGRPGREVVHYEAPPSKIVAVEMADFLRWFAATAPGGTRAAIDGFARAAIAHLWFETIHPFEDGNGRLGRAIADMAIAQRVRAPARLFSLSRQLQASRGAYYDALNHASRGDLVVTDWVRWFVRQCTAACRASLDAIERVMLRKAFWTRHEKNLNPRQEKVLRKLLDAGDGGFEGGMSADKYVKLTGVSKATATRDLSDMLANGQLWTHGIGKATRYYVDVPGWTHGIDARR